MTRQKVVSKSLVLNPSKWVHILRSVITAIHFSCLFVSLVHLRTYRHLSHTVLSCIVSCEYEHYVRISEQRCLMLVTPVLTFSNCILKTRVIKWPLKLYLRFYVFQIKKHDFLRFLSCCTHLLEHWLRNYYYGIPSPTHSFTLGLNPSFSANPPYRSLSFFSFRFHYTDFPDCLLLLLSISVFLLFSFFSVFTLF